MNTPRVEIDLAKITQNARYLVNRLNDRGITVTGVTKAVCGNPAVARAMLNGGVANLADARISNVLRMRSAGITDHISMIRAPLSHTLDSTVKVCSSSYNTELETIAKLGAAATIKGIVHDIVLMIEMGDLREGIHPGDIEHFVRCIVEMPGVKFVGLAANFACMGNLAPSSADMASLSRMADQAECRSGQPVRLVSGGGSANLDWALTANDTGRVNNLRLGESILLGTNPVSRKPIAGLHTDAFALIAEVLETRSKHDLSECGAPDTGSCTACSYRSVLAIGRQDTDTDGLSFQPEVSAIGSTSDHLVIDTGQNAKPVGSALRIGVNYSALMQAMNAPDVEKVLHRRG